jgi:hypothetical protein
MALQESKLSSKTSSSDLSLGDYSLLRKDRSAHGGGVGVAVAERLGLEAVVVVGGIPAPASLEAVAAHVAVKGVGLHFTFISVYRPPRLLAAESEAWVDSLHSYLVSVARPNWPIFMAGDVNLDRGLPEAQSLISALDSLGFNFISSDAPTHQKRAIDWILSDEPSCSVPGRFSYSMLPPLEKKVLGHATLVCQLHNFQGLGEHKRRPQRKSTAPPAFVWSLLDIEMAKGMALGLNHRLPPSDDPDNLLSAITKELWLIADECVPKRRYSPRHHNSLPWFDERCAQAHRDQKQAFHLRRLAARGPDPARLLPKAHSFLKSMRKRLKVAVKKAKCHFIQLTLSKAKSDHRLWEIYGLLSGKRQRGVSNLVVEGETLVEPGRIASALLDGFRDNFACAETNLGQEAPWEEPLEIPSSAHISDLACFGLLSRMSKRKAAGPDGLPGALLKALAGQLAAPVAQLLNLILLTQRIPKPWLDARVVPVPKVPTPTTAKDYRPISLLPTLSKVFERHLLQLLKLFLLDPSLPSQQFGFRPRSGCPDALLLLQERAMEMAFASKKAVKLAVLSLDLAKAFDRLPHATIILELQKRGCPEWLLRLCRGWLCWRRMRVNVGGEDSAWFNLPSSCPQGSITGPYFFSLAFAGVASLSLSPGAYLGFYADDTILMRDVSGPDGEDHLQQDLSALSAAIRDIGLSLNVTKTQLLLICFTPNPRLTMPLCLEGAQISESASLKLLGITLDQRLSFTPHFRRLASSAKAAVAAIARLVNRDPSALQYIFTQRVAPLLRYSLGCCVPGTATGWKALNAVPTYASRLLLNDFQSSSVEVRARAGLTSASDLGLQVVASYALGCRLRHRHYGKWWRPLQSPNLRQASLRSAASRELRVMPIPSRHSSLDRLLPQILREVWNCLAPSLEPLLPPNTKHFPSAKTLNAHIESNIHVFPASLLAKFSLPHL